MAGRVPRVLGCRKTSYTFRSSSVNRSSQMGMALPPCREKLLTSYPSFGGLLYCAGARITTMRYVLLSQFFSARCLFHKYTASHRRHAVGAQHAAPLLPGGSILVQDLRNGHLGVSRSIVVHYVSTRGVDPGCIIRGRSNGMARWSGSVSHGW